MIGSHAGNIDIQLPAVRAEQQVIQTMALLADQHQQARTPPRIVQLPLHCKALRQLRKRGTHLVNAGLAKIKVHPQEKAPALLIAKLLGIENVAAGLEQQAGNTVDNPGAVRAGQGKDVIVVAHR